MIHFSTEQPLEPGLGFVTMRAVLQCPKVTIYREKEKVIRKLKMPLNQQASRQPSTIVPGRASLVKRTLD